MLAARDNVCGYDGNADLYGVGVRVGLYAQWSATLLSTVFEPRSEPGLRTANLIIQLAVFLGLCTESARASATTPTGPHASAAVITQFLLCGSLSSVTGDGVGHLRSLSGAARLLFYTALSAYGCWFWFVGVDVMMSGDGGGGGGCEEVAFLGRASFEGWFRVLGKVASVLGLVTCVGLVKYWLYLVVTRFRSGFGSGLAANAHLYGGAKASRPRIELSLLALSAGLLVLSAMTVEYLIRANGVQKVGPADLDSVGQLIPLIAGCMGAALVVWRIIMHGLFLKKRCLFLFGFHL
ncbi:hypothetical protein ISF_05430 [Cordyceps fumosorosea ARSEF 2679]|uniref:Uncharacterized protein n=1 Tax=Cordyceps fumosorosea (strain ARSEF 2679) TaxID=1081104 RepID=A0A167U971_CORFA|nr:hypothetical protein ISF_05430 [Cordyceps fumosorosea ARSEF 2679]OAA61351.1 hypothetical protein ISF_05430 [Cordyceps fumosorosea ARSEF 2679]